MVFFIFLTEFFRENTISLLKKLNFSRNANSGKFRKIQSYLPNLAYRINRTPSRVFQTKYDLFRKMLCSLYVPSTGSAW